jgi:metal-sulfur cluster biosynthetic enzyme
MAPTITLERAAGVIGVPPQQLVDYLNLVLNASDPAPTESGVAPFDLDLVDSEVTREETVDALSQCYDPEIPVNIVELGLVYGVKVHEHSARAAITLTSPQCPAGDTLVSDVEQALLSLPGVTDARAKIMQEPRWSMARVSRAAKEALGLVGAR